MALSNLQQKELHQAILAYFRKHGYDEAYESFFQQTQLHPEQQHENMLESKWRSIYQLQKQIFQLEARNKQLEEDLRNYGKGLKVDASLSLPIEPAKHTLQGHREQVTCVAFHPIFNTLVSGGEDTTIKVWDPESGRFERTLKGHQDAVQSLAFNTNGTILASCSSDMSIKLWDFNTFQCLKTIQGHDHSVSAIQFLPSNDVIVSCSRDKTLKMWDVASGYCQRTLQGHDQWVRQLDVSPDGGLVASCSIDQTIKTWNAKTGECIRTYRDHEHVVETVAFSSLKADEFLDQLFRVSTATSEDSEGKSESSSSSSELIANLKKNLAALNGPREEKKQAKRVGGRYLVSGSRDRTIKIWDVESGECLRTLDGHDNWVKKVFFHPSGRFIVSCSDDKSIRVWDIAKNFRVVRKIEESHELFLTCLAWNRTVPMLASSSMDATIKIWDCRA